MQVTGAGVREHDDEYILEVYWENRAPETEYGITFLLGVNGIFVDPYMGLSSGSFDKDGYHDITVNPNLIINNEKIQSGLEDIYAHEEYTDIEMCFYLHDGWNLYAASNVIEERVHIYPQGEEKAVTYEREPESTDIVLIDNEDISIRVVGYEQTVLPYDTVKFFVENKTDKSLQFEIEEQSINLIVPYDRFSVNSNAIPAHMSAFYFETVCKKEFFEEYEITDVGTIQMLVRAYYTEENEDGAKTEVDLLKELITLYPQGEEHAKTFVKDSKDTDVVLLDNEYVTVISSTEKKISKLNSQENDIPLYITNKTDKIMALKLEALSVNCVMEDITNVNDEVYIFPNNQAVVYVEHFGEGDKKELLLRAYEYGGGTIGEDLVTERVTLITGEDTTDKVREEDTDIVLIDNEYMTVISAEMLSEEENPLNAYFYVINKTDNDMAFHIYDVALNDGVDSEDSYDAYIFAEESGYIRVYVYIAPEEGTLEKMEFSFSAYFVDYANGSVGENLVEKRITLEN